MLASIRVIPLLLCLCLGALVAHGKPARPTPKAVAAAKAHFKQGRAYQEAGAWADAIKEYEKAYALTPLRDLLYNIAQCHRLGGDKPKAIAAYERYLSLAQDEALADEARNHVAALKLKIQVEEAEAAKRRAQEDAAAARRRAKELEDARGQTAAEALRKLKEEQAEEIRRRQRTAAEAKRRREAAEKDFRRRVAAVQGEGRGLRIASHVLKAVGGVTMALGAIPIVTILVRDLSYLKDFDNGKSGTRWTTRLDNALEGQKRGRDLTIACFSTGGAVLIAGIVLEVVGTRQRRRAERAVERPVTLVPLLSPGGSGALLQGRF